jgi:hypothetical protein
MVRLIPLDLSMLMISMSNLGHGLFSSGFLDIGVVS